MQKKCTNILPFIIGEYVRNKQRQFQMNNWYSYRDKHLQKIKVETNVIILHMYDVLSYSSLSFSPRGGQGRGGGVLMELPVDK